MPCSRICRCPRRFGGDHDVTPTTTEVRAATDRSPRAGAYDHESLEAELHREHERTSGGMGAVAAETDAEPDPDAEEGDDAAVFAGSGPISPR
jgi:hypothetical protein